MVDDLCFHTYEEFSPPSNWAGILGRDLGLKTGILALRLGSESEGRGTEEEEEEKEKKEEELIPHMCESIGHRPLWGRCPKKHIYSVGYQFSPGKQGFMDLYPEGERETTMHSYVRGLGP